jgi:hypothetical protein
MEADLRFFERRPDRRHRTRRTHSAELRHAELLIGERFPVPPPGSDYLTVVKRVAPGVHVCVFTLNVAGCETDLSEGLCHLMFEMIVTDIPATGRRGKP